MWWYEKERTPKTWTTRETDLKGNEVGSKIKNRSYISRKGGGPLEEIHREGHEVDNSVLIQTHDSMNEDRGRCFGIRGIPVPYVV